MSLDKRGACWRLYLLCLSCALSCSTPAASTRQTAASTREASTEEVPAPQPALTPEEAAQAANDSPPDATGWGTAAGLRYLEIVRGDAEAAQKLPLLVVIHGMGDAPSQDWLRAIDVDPGTPVRMILPQAPTAYGSGYSWFEYRFADRVESELARGITSAATRLSRLLQVVRTQRPTRGRALVTGFSQGGMLSFALALAHPEQIALAVPISGYVPEPLWPQAPPPKTWFPNIRALHGTADALVSYAADAKAVAQLRTLGYPVELFTFDAVQHTIAPDMSSLVRRMLTEQLKASTHTANAKHSR